MADLKGIPVQVERKPVRSGDKFVTPQELEAAMSHADLRVVDERGVVYNLLSDAWGLSDDMDVNYMLTAAKSG